MATESSVIPEAYADLVERPAAHVATLGPKGEPREQPGLV